MIILRTLSRLLALATATLVSMTSQATVSLSNAEAAKLIQDALNERGHQVVPLLTVNVLADSMGYVLPTKEGISMDHKRRFYETLARMSVVKLSPDPAYADWFAGRGKLPPNLPRPPYGTAERVVITVGDNGRKFLDPANPGRLIIRSEYRDMNVLRNEPRNSSTEILQFVVASYAIEQPPELQALDKAMGKAMGRKRKLQALIRFDPVNRAWAIAAADFASVGGEFETKKVEQYLRR